MQNDKKQNPIFRIIKLFIWIFIIYIVYFTYTYINFDDKIFTNESQVISIKKGDVFLNIADKIEGINKTYLKLYLKNNKPDFELKVGNYKIDAQANIEKIISDLNKSAIIDETSVTILEGWNIYDIDNYFSKNGYIEAGEYISYVQNPEKIKALKEFFPFLGDITTLEGFLYPDTYEIATPVKINDLVIKQLENFESKVYNKILTNLKKDQIYDLVNLASIVEKEEKNPKEKSTVAGILKKRLNSDWMIGADITVCYPHKLTSEECSMVVSKYINEKNDYNTRTMVGLPKTPIGNPSYETIYATLNDKETRYWYYLHNSTTGKIYYAKTNEEHEYNKVNFMK